MPEPLPSEARLVSVSLVKFVESDKGEKARDTQIQVTQIANATLRSHSNKLSRTQSKSHKLCQLRHT